MNPYLSSDWITYMQPIVQFLSHASSFHTSHIDLNCKISLPADDSLPSRTDTDSTENCPQLPIIPKVVIPFSSRKRPVSILYRNGKLCQDPVDYYNNPHYFTNRELQTVTPYQVAGAFQCSCCGRLFSSAADLQAHERMDLTERPFECGICRRRFKQKKHWKRHLGTHSNEKNHSCDICSKSFRRMDNMKSHRQTHFLDRDAKRCTKPNTLFCHPKEHMES